MITHLNLQFVTSPDYIIYFSPILSYICKIMYIFILYFDKFFMYGVYMYISFYIFLFLCCICTKVQLKTFTWKIKRERARERGSKRAQRAIVDKLFRILSNIFLTLQKIKMLLGHTHTHACSNFQLMRVHTNMRSSKKLHRNETLPMQNGEVVWYSAQEKPRQRVPLKSPLHCACVWLWKHSCLWAQICVYLLEREAVGWLQRRPAKCVSHSCMCLYGFFLSFIRFLTRCKQIIVEIMRIKTTNLRRFTILIALNS